MYKIYIVRNTVNGKIYVGLTSKTVDQRWKLHLANARALNPTQYITRAIKKHGEKNFKIKQIDKCETRQMACGLEMAYILLYQATNPELGYNNTYGGDGVLATPEVRAKIGAAHRGVCRPHTAETKLKISQTMVGIPKPPSFGKKVSAGKKGHKLGAQSCRNMSEAHKGNPAPNRRTDISDEQVAALYNQGLSLSAIGRYFQTSHGTVGRRLSSMGLIKGGYNKKAKKWWMQTN